MRRDGIRDVQLLCVFMGYDSGCEEGKREKEWRQGPQHEDLA